MPTKKASVTSLDEVRVAKATPSTDLVNLDPAVIDPHPLNPRKHLGDLSELVASVQARGILQPVVVIPHPDDASRYRMLAGHRRTAAAIQTGLATVPAVVRGGLSPAAQLELMLLENLQRTDLTVIEEGAGYQGLLDLGVKRTEIAAHTGRAVSTVAQRIKVASLPEAMHARIIDKQVTLEEAADFADLRTRDQELFDAAVNAVDARAVRDALAEADRRDRIAALKKEWAENGHEFRLGYVDPNGGSLSVIHDLEMEVDEHAHCEGAVVVVSNWALKSDPRDVGRFVCVKPELHKERLAELANLKATQAAAGIRPGETAARRAEREQNEKFTADLTVAAAARTAWVLAQFIGDTSGDIDVYDTRSALWAHAATIAEVGEFTAVLDLWREGAAEHLRTELGAGSPAYIEATVALAVLSAREVDVPYSGWHWQNLTRNGSPRLSILTGIYEYLTLLESIGYEPTPAETTMVVAIADLLEIPADDEGPAEAEDGVE